MSGIGHSNRSSPAQLLNRALSVYAIRCIFSIVQLHCLLHRQIDSLGVDSPMGEHFVRHQSMAVAQTLHRQHQSEGSWIDSLGVDSARTSDMCPHLQRFPCCSGRRNRTTCVRSAPCGTTRPNRAQLANAAGNNGSIKHWTATHNVACQTLSRTHTR